MIYKCVGAKNQKSVKTMVTSSMSKEHAQGPKSDNDQKKVKSKSNIMIPF